MTHSLAPALFAISSITLSVSCLQAETFLVDFRDLTGSSYPDSSTWNVYDDPTALNGSAIVNTANNAGSGITLTGAGDLSASGVTSNYNAGLGAPAWTNADAAAGDYFWTGDTNGTTTRSATLTFGGLTIGDEVSLDLFASRSSGSNVLGNYEYSLNGGTTWFGFTVLERNGSAATTNNWDNNDTQSQLFNLDETGGYELGRYMNISDVTLTSNSLLVRLTAPAASTAYTGINSLQLTVIPEPSTSATLFGIVAALACFIRRRQ